MKEPQFKIGDIVTANSFCGEKIIFAIAGIRIQKDGKIFYYTPGLDDGYEEENVRLADSQKNQYDRLFEKSREEYHELLADFRTVAKTFAEKDPDMGSWLLCNWASKLEGFI